MPAGEGQGIHEENAQRHIREETIYQDGKEIVVVGVSHDSDDSRGLAFDGRETAEVTLKHGFGVGNKPDALLVDSLYCLGEEESTGSFLTQGLIKQIIDPRTDINKLSLNFWPIRYAFENGADLILGDPVTSTVPNYLDYIGNKLDRETQERYRAEQQVAIENAQTDEYAKIQKDIASSNTMKLRAKVGFGAGVVLPLVGYGVYRGSRDQNITKSLTRRQLIKRGLGYTAGVGVGALGLQQAESVLSNRVSHLKGRQTGLLGGYPVIPSYEVGMTRDELINRDNSAFQALSNSYQTLDDSTRESPSFQRIAHHNEETMPMILVLRNAIMADVLAAPTDELTTAAIEPGKDAKLGVVLGASHVIIPETCSVSYLVKHPEKREELLRNLLRDFVPATREEFGEEGVAEFLEQLRTFAKLYKVHPDGTVAVSRVHPPQLLSILSDEVFLRSLNIGGESHLPSTSEATMVPESTLTPTQEARSTSTLSPTSSPTPSPTEATEPSPSATLTPEEDLIEVETIKAVRAKHLLSVYGASMDKDTFGVEPEPGVYQEGKVEFMKELVKVGDDLAKHDKSLVFKLAAVMHFFSPGFGPDLHPDNDVRGGLLQLTEGEMRVLEGVSYEDMRSMPPVEQLKYIVKPYLAYYQSTGLKISTVEDLAMAILDPASIGKDGATPILHSVSRRQEPFYKRVVSILESAGQKPVDEGVLTMVEIGNAIRINAEVLGELEKNLY